MMLGFLLARSGVDVVVLEKHSDFLRDFRGDTIHPSTLQVMRELGLFDEFRQLLQNEITTLDVVFGDRRITPIDFSHLPAPCNFLGLAPQWDFLDFLASKAKEYDGFTLLMETEVTDIRRSAERITGVVASGPSGPVIIDADLVVAADGRSSVVRSRAGLTVRETGVPIDILWFRLAKPTPEPPDTLGYFGSGDMVLTIDRGDYYQGGMLITKGSFDRIKADGIDRFRSRIATTAAVLSDVVGDLTDFDQVKLLSVQIDHLPTWHQPGLLCIGDAAHAMSPAFGVGVNYAVQDAVAAAKILTTGLLERTVSARDLAAVQRRRAGPTRLMQRIQVRLHQRIARPGTALAPSFVARVLVPLSPILQRLAARLVGLGFRPEHVDEGRR